MSTKLLSNHLTLLHPLWRRLPMNGGYNLNALHLLAFFLVFASASTTLAQAGRGPGGQGFRGGQGQQGQGQRAGRGPGQGLGRGLGAQSQGGGVQGDGVQGERHRADQQVFQFLLANHEKIRRTVTELPNGVETLTESDDADVAANIKEHVKWMEYRIDASMPIRMRDPLFAEIFKHTDQIEMQREETEKGVRVKETSGDPKVVQLIQAHAKVVSGFVARGFAEAMKGHAVPKAAKANAANANAANDEQLKPSFPAVADHGSVVRLPTAAQQPRDGTQLIIDVTRGSDPDKLNEAIEKVAKYVNLYAGGGEKPASAKFAVVFHGDATLAVLHADAYQAKFKTEGNPNLELLHELHELGVELYVCGQSLISKGQKPEDVAIFVDTAVSALTTVVNLQSDGYAYVPLGN